MSRVRVGEQKEQSFSELLYGSPNWVNEDKTINNCFSEVKSTKQGELNLKLAKNSSRLCDLTGA